jgi:hypothetical protein
MNCKTKLFEQEYADLLLQWKQEAIARGQTVIGTVLLKHSCHTSLIHLKIEVNRHHTADATLLYFSSTGERPAIHYLHDNCFQITYAVFGESTAKVELKLAEDNLQHTSTGCTVFTLYFYETLMNFDKIMAYNNQYSYSNTSNSIFTYAEDHHTHYFSYPYGKKIVADDVSYSGVATANLFSMPTVMTIGKQYYSDNNDPSNLISCERYKYTQRADGSYQEESLGWQNVRLSFNLNVNDQRKPIRGLDEQREALRLQEFDKPADITGTKTINEVLDEVSVKQASGKTFNIKINQIRHELTFRITQRLSFFAASPEATYDQERTKRLCIMAPALLQQNEML